MKKTVEERFWEKVNKNGPVQQHMATRCHLWTAAKHVQGYGLFQYTTRTTRRAHRVAWEFKNGPIPPGKDVLHHCDVEACVRNDHLYLGTSVENARDRVVRGRAAKGKRHGSVTCPGSLPSGEKHYAKQRPELVLRGEQHGRALLTEEQVRAIRAEHTGAYGELPKLAKKYGVGKAVIERIVRFETWKHVA